MLCNNKSTLLIESSHTYIGLQSGSTPPQAGVYTSIMPNMPHKVKKTLGGVAFIKILAICSNDRNTFTK